MPDIDSMIRAANVLHHRECRQEIAAHSLATVPAIGCKAERVFARIMSSSTMGAGTRTDRSIVNGSAGDDMFSGILDQQLAPHVGEGWHRGLAEVLYRQFRNRIAARSNREESSR